MALTPERVRAFREDYKRERVPAGYRGWLHLAFTTAVCLGAIAISLARVGEVSWSAWLTVPIAWAFANLVEYGMHRGPLHQLGPFTARLYKRHTSEHHRYFSRELMAIDEPRDIHATIFPPWMALVFVGLIGVPAALLVAWVLGADVGLIFYAAIVAYYLNFEWMHLALHVPAHWWLARLPLVAWAREHHGLHHDPARMRRANFNFAYPLGDWLFGTFER
ncbi:fatty acid hydroxylase family protein [Nannocystaceae bacterium ST9]